ncbi:MAG: response regulator transcription factor [Myxococcota bacterium]
MGAMEDASVILLVDDDPNILKTVGTRLEAEGYRVVTAADGDKALKLALGIKPDLIILDVNLPGRIGYAVSRMLKLDEGAKYIPILMLTGRDEDADFRLGAMTGADAYMTKPFETAALVESVARLLRERGQA